MKCKEVRRTFTNYYLGRDVEISDIEQAYRHTFSVDGASCKECGEHLKRAKEKISCVEVCNIFYAYYRETPRNDDVELVDIEKAYCHTFNSRGIKCEKCNYYLKKVKDKKKAV